MVIKRKTKRATGKKTRGSAKQTRKVTVKKKVSKKKLAQKKKPAKKQTKKILKPVKKVIQKKTAGKGKKSVMKPKTKTKPKVKAKTRPARSEKAVRVKIVKPKRRTVPLKTSSTRARTSSPGQLSRQEMLKKLLIQRREEIVREAKAEIAKYIKGEATQLVETALDDGDWSVIDLSADINLRLLETHRESLLKIDESLRKLREGSYGICEDCSGEISAERLNVMPFAIFCRDCQERREEIEKVTREEIPG